MQDVYTLEDLAAGPDLQAGKHPIRLGVFGDPIEHSLSPQMQNAALAASGLEMAYAKFQIEPDELKDALENIRAREFVGINLTVPHKVTACALLDELDPAAAQIGAVNTVVVRDGRLVGFNTDGAGFARAIQHEFNKDLRDLRILLFGAGGAGRAVAHACAGARCKRLTIINRDSAKGERLAAGLGDQKREINAAAWVTDVIAREAAEADLIVNATSVGIGTGRKQIIEPSAMRGGLMVFDTVYSDQPTRLVSDALSAGARAANGLSMLLYQGAAAFEVWFERKAPIEEMRQALFSAAGR